MQASLDNYSVEDLFRAGFAALKEGMLEAGRYFYEIEQREQGGLKRLCKEIGGDFRDAERSTRIYAAYAQEPKPEKPIEPRKEPVSSFERALKTFMKMPATDKKRFAETVVSILEAA